MPNGPLASGRTWSREATGCGCAPVARTSSTAALSKRSNNAPTGSSTRSMPATAAVPGITQTSSAL